MRHNTGALGAITALTAGCLVGLSGVALAAPSHAHSLYAPSALVLTIGKGDDSATTVQHATLLRCEPTAGGDHPAANAACAELRAVGGQFDDLSAADSTNGRVCTKIWDPVFVTADGVWEGRRVNYAHTFPNRCSMEDAQGDVFAF